MQYNDDKSSRFATRPRLARTRIVGIDPAEQVVGPFPRTDDLGKDASGVSTDHSATVTDRALVPLVSKAVRRHLPMLFASGNGYTSVEEQSAAHLMQLSGMVRPMRTVGATTDVLPTPAAAGADEDGYWPLGIQQTGPLVIRNLYGREPFGCTLPHAVPLIMPGAAHRTQELRWQKWLNTPAFKVSLGLLVGLGLFWLVARFVDLPLAFQVVGAHLGGPQGMALALCAGVAYLAGHTLRGVRWKLFLHPVGKVSTFQVIKLYQVAVFLNFLLPVRAGEAAKCLTLKRVAHIPISKSLPTVAMDKALDLVPALVLMVLMPLLGIALNLQLWLLFGVFAGILVALVLFVGLVVWQRSFAMSLLQRVLGLLPGTLGSRIEGIVTGFVDGLLVGISRPTVFLAALLLTGGAALCDGLFALLAFRAIGLPISFSVALLGYSLYNLFSVLPTPPGQFGSNEAIGLLVFGGLLGLPGESVLAMAIFSHLWTASIVTIAGIACMNSLGLSVTSALRARKSAS